MTFNCCVCSDTGFCEVIADDGKRCGVKRCACQQAAYVSRALERIPRAFGTPDLMTIEPRPDLYPKQASVIKYLQANPAESYLLAGDNGTGKTFLAFALYAQAARSGRRVVALTIQTLLEQFRRVSVGDAAPNGEAYCADISMSDLQQNRTKYTLLLDEFEKARPSEFASEMLYGLVDAAWKHEHQLIVTTNMRIDELAERWSRIDAVYGRSIAKRIAAMCKGIGFFGIDS